MPRPTDFPSPASGPLAVGPGGVPLARLSPSSCYTVVRNWRSYLDISQIVAELTAERNRIDQAIAALDGSHPRGGRPPKALSSQAGPRIRTMSPAARKRISAAMKLRWATRKGKSASKKAAPPARKAPARKPMSPAARKKLAALMKARWAARKKAGATTL